MMRRICRAAPHDGFYLKNKNMAETATECAERAGECARLANLTRDGTIQTELLKLRQTYLARATALGLAPHDALALSNAAEKKAKP